MILVKGPWYETPGSPNLPFVLNQSMSFPGVFKLWERHNEILLTAKNLLDLGRSLSLYIILVIPRPLPAEILEGEHYIIVDLLNLAPGSSSPAKNFEIEAVGENW